MFFGGFAVSFTERSQRPDRGFGTDENGLSARGFNIGLRDGFDGDSFVISRIYRFSVRIYKGKKMEQENQPTEQTLDAEVVETSEKKESAKKVKKDKILKIKESEYQKVVQEAADYKDKWMRLYAEFENVRKRTEREKTEFVKYANEGLVVDFLNILDDLERSILAANDRHEDYDAFLKGVEMVMAHIYEMLKKHQVKPMEVEGKLFDPHCHEILMQEETNEHDDGSVVEVFQKGYYLAEKVVRTAKVKVAVNKSEEAKQENEEVNQENQENEEN